MIKRNKIRILEVVNDLRLGGIEKLVHDLVFHVDQARFSVEVCCVREKTGPWLNSIEDHDVSVHFLGNYRKNPFLFFSKFNKLLHEKKYQVVHVHLNQFSGLFLYHPFRNHVPLRVAHYHSDFTPRNRLLVKRFLFLCFRKITDRYANNVIGISDACLDSVYGHHRRQQQPNIKRIYNGVELNRFSEAIAPHDAHRALGIDPVSVVIGHVGRFRHEKNHAFIVEIASRLCPRFKNLVFLLVGDGPLMDDIEKLAQEKGLSKQFVFTGARTDIPELMQLMNLFIFPSLWEGFGLAVIEAQAAGLPVITSDHIPSEIPLLNLSRRISLDDMEAWVSACEQLIKDNNVSSRHLQPAGELLREFSIETWVEKIEALYVEGGNADT